jgi:hypothetical protein
MFVYQNNDGNICITFEGNVPVETPDYILVIDREKKTVNITPAVDGEDVSAVNELEDRVAELEKEVTDLGKVVAEKDAKIKELEAKVENTEEA